MVEAVPRLTSGRPSATAGFGVHERRSSLRAPSLIDHTLVPRLKSVSMAPPETTSAASRNWLCTHHERKAWSYRSCTTVDGITPDRLLHIDAHQVVEEHRGWTADYPSDITGDRTCWPRTCRA